MEAGLAAAAHPAARQTFDQDVGRHVDVDGHADGAATFGEPRFERVGLRHVAWEAVEQHASHRVGCVEAVDDHVDHQLIRHQIATIHEFLRSASEVRALLPMLAQQVAAGDHRHAQSRAQEARLCAFPRAGRPEQQDHLVVPLQPHRCSPPCEGT